MRRNYKPLGEMVYEQLRHMIITGQLKPGQPLVTSHLSKEFDTSVIPVREAIQRLGSEGLVDIVPHKGATVSKYEAEDIRQLYAVRKLLETEAAVLAMNKITPEAIKELEDLLQQMQEALEAEDYQAYSEMNNHFHAIMYEPGENKWLVHTIFELWGKTRRSDAAVKHNLKHRQQMFEQHHKLIKAFKEKSHEEQIRRLVAEHVDTAMRGVLDYIKTLDESEVGVKN